ncbi:ornithine cyclodeaminase family protein [Salinigranum marinum]|uniref:ornithine cyclodeaminase family protein n=1 Tax=Salinigranum marinum TaxID=1515595 RepID=UPI002989A7D0|nr:ornithine cyclodeaminase family protein [Salinigranum marinum]
MRGALYLSSEDVAGLATTTDFVDAVRRAYRERGDGAPTHPRVTLRRDEPAGLLNSYTAILPDTGVAGGYVYTAGFADGEARLTTPLFDAETGAVLAIVDGAYLNTYKTGAAGAVAVDALARPDATTVAVVGSGAQARGQLRAVATVREFEAARVFSPTPAHREQFADEMTDVTGLPVEACDSAAAAVDGADVVVTATNASEPVVASDDLADGAHVNAIGQYDPEKRELDAETIRRATYVPDLRERVFQDAGAFLQAREAGVVDDDHIHAELGAVVAGHAPGRTSPDKLTVFDSGGTALETLAAAALCYRKAEAAGRGRRIEFADASEVYEGKHGDTSEEL